MFNGKKVAVTGAAGFIGSHTVDELLSQGAEVLAIDNMKTGQPAVVEEHKKNKNYRFLKVDVLDKSLIGSLKEVDFIFHLAANADIRGGMKNTAIDLEQNTIATHNVLEAMRQNSIKGIAFSSSAAVYGTQKAFPTPEDAPKVQTSLYGASKLSAEAFIEAYSEYYGINASIYRFVSVVGERYPHGVVIDFYRKLISNPHELEILGDGKQKKSFMYVKDCVAGMMLGAAAVKKGSSVFNLGQNYTIGVDEVAHIVTQEMGLKDVSYRHTGGEIGWVGDQPIVLLSTKKIESFGWKPKTSIEDGLRKTIRYLVNNKVI
jgi:UDP-glucose 4-epimerase